MGILASLALHLLGIGKIIGQWLSRRSLAELACLALVLVCGVQTIRIEGLKIWPLSIHGLKADLKDATDKVVKCGQARHADQEAYRKAQADAQAKNQAQLERVKFEQQRISDHAELSYEADLARLRAELAKRLPHGGTSTPQGAPLNPGASQVPDAPGKPDEEARVCIPSSLYVRGAENELQLERLIDWVSEQSKVDPNQP